MNEFLKWLDERIYPAKSITWGDFTWVAFVLLLTIISSFILNRLVKRRVLSHYDLPADQVANVINLITYLLYSVAAFVVAERFQLGSYEVSFGTGGEYRITQHNFILSLIVFFALRILIWFLMNIALYHFFERKNVDKGRKVAINQIVLYLAYIIAVLIVVQTMGIDVTVILAGSAALLVGIGFGLQSTINDLISGIILLFDGTIRVGDTVRYDSEPCTVQKIGLRTSYLITANNVDMIVPNSKFINDSVVNYSRIDNNFARFSVEVGVSYSSVPEEVRESLLRCVQTHSKVDMRHEPVVFFKAFGDSALIFEIMFWTTDALRIEQIKSDIRFAIWNRFKEADIEIAFPQRDLHVKEPIVIRQESSNQAGTA